MEILIVLLLTGIMWRLQKAVYRHYGLRHIEYKSYLSTKEAYEGDVVELVEEISNRKALPVPWLKSEITTSRWLSFAGSQSAVTDQTRFVPSFFMLRGHQKVTRRWKVTCLRYGEHPIVKTTLVTGDLLGNVVLSKPAAIRSSITVLPRPLPLDEFALSSRHSVGELMVRRRLLPDPFLRCGVREYEEFDPLSHINWMASAKEKKWMVHRFDATAQQKMAVVLNMQTNQERAWDHVNRVVADRGVHVCAACFDSTLASGIPVRFLTNASTNENKEASITCTNEAWGRTHVIQLLRVLAQLRLEVAQDFDSFLRDKVRQLEATDLVIVTAHAEGSLLRFVQEEQERGIAVKILLVSPPARPVSPGLEVYDVSGAFCREEDLYEKA